MKEKKFRQAIKSYEEALKENPELPAQVKLNLGHAYYETGQNRQAQKYYLASMPGLTSPSEKANACLQLGNLFVREKDYKSALDWFQKSLLQQPDNRIARKNFELAWHLNKKKEEEEKKKNPERNQDNQQQNNQNQKKEDPGQNKSGQNQTGNGKDGATKPNQNQQSKKNGEEKSKDSKKQEEKRGGEEKEEEKDLNGQNSKKKTNESNAEDPESYRVDRQKLRESGLNEEQAKNMLQAMRQSEVKYLQQRRFKGKNGSKSKSGPRW